MRYDIYLISAKIGQIIEIIGFLPSFPTFQNLLVYPYTVINKEHTRKYPCVISLRFFHVENTQTMLKNVFKRELSFKASSS
jgi:hypothetical protein